jgi:hypothetical protein
MLAWLRPNMPRQNRRSASAFMKRLLICAVLGLCGCGQLSRIGECKRFVGLANPTAAELRALDSSNKIEPNSKAYKELSARFGRFSKEITALGLRDRSLKEGVTAIRETVDAAAKECQHYAEDLHDYEKLTPEDPPNRQAAIQRKLKKTHSKMTQALRNYRTQVVRINALCQPAP